MNLLRVRSSAEMSRVHPSFAYVDLEKVERNEGTETVRPPRLPYGCEKPLHAAHEACQLRMSIWITPTEQDAVYNAEDPQVRNVVRIKRLTVNEINLTDKLGNLCVDSRLHQTLTEPEPLQYRQVQLMFAAECFVVRCSYYTC